MMILILLPFSLSISVLPKHWVFLVASPAVLTTAHLSPMLLFVGCDFLTTAKPPWWYPGLMLSCKKLAPCGLYRALMLP